MWFRKSFRNRKEKLKEKNKDEEKLIKNDVPDLLVNLDTHDTHDAPPFNHRYGNIEELSEQFSDVYEMSTLTTYQSDLSISEDPTSKVVMREKPSRPTSFMSIRLSNSFDDKYYQTMKRPEFNPYSKSYYSYHNLARDRYMQSQKRQSKEINRLSTFSDMEETYEKKKQKKSVARTRSLSARGSTFKGFEGIINSIRRRPSQRVEISKPVIAKPILNLPIKTEENENDTILHSASTNGQIDIVRFYAESGRYVNNQNKYLNTPLHCAVYSGHSNIVELLLQNHADCDIQNLEGDTALHIAISNESMDIAEMLIEHAFNLDIQNENGDTALHIAAYKQMSEIIRKLVDKKANILIQNNRGNTPLHICFHGATKSNVVEYLVSSMVPIRDTFTAMKRRKEKMSKKQQKANKNIDELKHVSKRFVDNIVRSAMEHLILKGYTYIDNSSYEDQVDEIDSVKNEKSVELSKETEILLENYVEPLDILNFKGDAIIHRAVKYCDIEIIQILLNDKNISKDMKNSDGDTILHLATKIGSLEAVKTILKSQKQLIDVPDYHGNTPLHCAIAKENIPIIQHIIKNGCNINLQNRLLNTPLHVGVLMRRFDILKLLIEIPNIDSTLKNLDGNIPLHCAILTGNINIIQAIKEISEDCINVTNNADENALHVLLQCKSVSRGETDVLMKYLIENHVDFNKQDRMKNTPLHLCLEKKLKSISNYLLSLRNIQVDLQNLAGDTALHLMAKYNNVEALNKVNCEGWVFDIVNNNNETPLDIALELSLTEMGESIMQKKWGFSFPI